MSNSISAGNDNNYEKNSRCNFRQRRIFEEDWQFGFQEPSIQIQCSWRSSPDWSCHNLQIRCEFYNETSNIQFMSGSWYKQNKSYILKSQQIPPSELATLHEEVGRDVDIIKRNIFKVEEPEKFECTLEEELQPPAYRKEVIEMIRVAKKGQKEKYPHNTGLSYYPFQR